MASWDIYKLLIDYARSDAVLTELVLGINWSVARVEMAGQSDNHHCGLCFSPTQLPRTIPWAGTLPGRTTNELSEWITQWDSAAAVVGALVINAVINGNSPLLLQSETFHCNGPPHLRVFQHFRSQLAGQKVVVVGHYPDLGSYAETSSWYCLERNPRSGNTPDTAAEYLIPEADWVFITASSIANKTLPRLLELAKNAQVVLMGPSLPWLEDWAEFGVNYLAGVEVLSAEKLWQVASQAGGTRIFDEACQYRLARLQ